MVASSRCLFSSTVLLAAVHAARISRKANSTLAEERAQDCYSAYDGKALLSLKPCASAATVLSQLSKHGCILVGEDEKVLAVGCKDTEAVCSPKAAAALSDIGTLVQEDAGQYWRQSSGTAQTFIEGMGIASDFYTNWRDLDAMMARVRSSVAASGGAATIETAGKSLQGRDMKIVRLRGRGWQSGGTRVVATYNLHAREWITGMAGVYTVENLIEKVKQDPSYLEGVEVVLMPMANPDGFVYSATNTRMHRKNMATTSSSRCPGVDLNRNFDSHWASGGSSSNPCSDTYHGPRANSEPETQVVASVMNEAPMTVYVDVHSYSELIISSYGWTTADHPRKAEYRALGGSIQSAIRASGGKTWTEGAAAQVLYAASGCTDDYADDRGALGVCFELRPGRWGGGGFAPPTSQILPGAQESYAGLLAAIDYAKSPPPTTTAAPGNCPWHGCIFGCWGNDCQYCERCQ